jgi:DNA-binding transcriptional ArsR family regulator
MIESLITSKTRIKLLVKFFLNPTTKAYLRQLAVEFNESTNSVRIELNRLTEAGILESEREGQTIVYQAKKNHPLFPELKSLVSKYTGMDVIIDEVVSYLGTVVMVYLVGDYASGNDTGTIEVVLVGDIRADYLTNLVERVKREISRDFSCVVLTQDECDPFFANYTGKKLLLWTKSL